MTRHGTWIGCALMVVQIGFGAVRVQAAGDDFRLSAPSGLNDSGVLEYLLPRFSLKTGVRIERTEGGASLGTQGVPVFRGPDQLWYLDTAELPGAARFLDWLTSDVGQRTLMAFPGGGYHPDTTEPAIVAPVEIAGDAALGEDLSLSMCGRCHVVNDKNRMDGLGSTPSFAVLRTLPDWQNRFETFYVLAPHAAFTQIDGVTAPFDPLLPSPIAPVELTLEDLEAMTAYIATVPAADLGAPVASR